MIDANTISTGITSKAGIILHNPKFLLYGVILIIITIVIIKFLKSVVVNSIVGAAGLLILNFVFHVKLPFLITFIITCIFGAAGLGVMVILKFLGII
jgi:hypothetical protein